MRTKKYCFLLVRNVICNRAVFCLLFLASSLALKAQDQAETGLPFITNYSPKTFNALPQTWCAQEDESGIMYFGIQNYILEYDGVKWRKINLPVITSASVVRAMAKNKEGTIYYGGFGDIGYLAQDSLGQTRARSLLNLIPAAHRNFLDIWSAYSTESGIYFQARESIFRLDDKAGKGNEKTPVKVWLPKTKFMYSFYLDGNYYVHQQGMGLFKMVNDSLVLIPGSEFLGKERMQVMMPYKTTTNEKQYLIGLFYTGLYLFDGTNFRPFASKADPIIKSGSILYKGLQLKNGNYVLSTTGKGLVIMDAQGNMLQRINRDVGLQDESIYSAFEDKKGALWLSLDNGISRVEIGSPLTKFGLQSGINTGVLTIKRFEEKIFIGTTNGILKFDKQKAYFDPVAGVPQNQIFSLVVDGNELLVPGDGLFAIKHDQTFSIRKSVSADLTLSALSLPAKNPNLLLGGGTFGIAVFQRNGDSLSKADRTWHFQGYIHGITDQIWSFAENADGSLWAGTQNGFAYRVRLSVDDKGNVDPEKTTFEKYGPEHGLRNALGQVYSIKGTNYFIADSGLYIFNDKLNHFIPDSTFGTFKNGGGNSQFDMVEDYLGRVWIRFGKETRLMVPKPEGGYRIEKTHLDAINELTIQKIYPEKNGIVWLCTTDGLVRYDENREKNYDQTYKTVLRQVSAGKEILNPNISGETKRSSVSYNNSTLRFEYAAPFFEQEDKTKYQTWLEGFEKGWSDWDNNYYKEYTNLPDGKYTFHVRALNIYEKISDEAVYSFEILPPWYRTWWAYLLYALIAISLIGLIIRWRTRQLHEKHRELEKIVAQRTSELSHRVEELAVINSVQDGLVREMNMHGIYELVGEKIREIFHAQVIDIATYDKSTNMMEDHYAYEKGDRTLVGKWEPFGFRKMVVESGQLLLINHDLERKSAEAGSKAIHGEQPKSAVWVPMVRGTEVKGMISLQDLDKEDAFTDADVNLLTTLANSMTVALESARRFDETTRLLKETDQRNAELAVINSVQEGLVREMEMQGIYDLVGEKIREIFDAQVIDIVTYDSKTNLIEDRYSYEKGDRTLLGTREPQGFRKQVIETRKPIFINENLAEHMHVSDNPVLVGEVPKSIVFVPMMSGNELKGIISLQNVDHEHAFSNSDLSLLTTLANSMSVALESARLFDETNRLLKETEQRTAELAVINSVQDGLAKEMDMQGIYNLVGTRVQELFNAQVVMIATFDYDKKLEYFNYHIEKGEVSVPEPRKYDKLREELIKTKQKIVINKHSEEISAKYGMRVVPGTEFPKSLLFVPLVSGDKVKSYVSLQNIDKENAFSDSDVRCWKPWPTV
jgi:FOG: GAF domain